MSFCPPFVPSAEIRRFADSKTNYGISGNLSTLLRHEHAEVKAARDIRLRRVKSVSGGIGSRTGNVEIEIGQRDLALPDIGHRQPAVAHQDSLRAVGIALPAGARKHTSSRCARPPARRQVTPRTRQRPGRSSRRGAPWQTPAVPATHRPAKGGAPPVRCRRRHGHPRSAAQPAPAETVPSV